MNIANQQALMSMNRSQNHEFAQLKNSTLDDKKMAYAAQEFETLFIEMMFKEMKKTLSNTDLSGNETPGKQIFGDMLYTEYARESSKTGGFGLAKMIEQSLKPQIQPKFDS